MRQASHLRDKFPSIRFLFPLAQVRLPDSITELKTIFDGTKLPTVVRASQNHHPWYED